MLLKKKKYAAMKVLSAQCVIFPGATVIATGFELGRADL